MKPRWRKPLICGAIVGVVSSVAVPVTISIATNANRFPFVFLNKNKLWHARESLFCDERTHEFGYTVSAEWVATHYFIRTSMPDPRVSSQYPAGVVPAWLPRPYSRHWTHAAAVGFPMRSLFGWSSKEESKIVSGGLRTGDPGVFDHGWIQLARLQLPARDLYIEFPYLPIWSGLIVNALTHAAAWSALFLGLAQLLPSARRARRTRRGLCPACAYDLRHELASGCSECGWRRGGPAPMGAPSSENRATYFQ